MPMASPEPAPGYHLGDWSDMARWLSIPYAFPDIGARSRPASSEAGEAVPVA